MSRAARIVRSRRGPFAAGGRWSGRAARRLATRLRGSEAIVVEIRNPPFAMRGVQIDSIAWPVRWLRVGDHTFQVGQWTFRPVGIPCRHGRHPLQLLDARGGLVKSTLIAVRRGDVVIVTVFPPTTHLVESKNVRKISTIEVHTLHADG